MVAACYLYGFGVEKSKRASIKWCKLGADFGDVNCMHQLIHLHHEGLATGNYVKIDRHQLMEYVCELLFANFTFHGETYLGNRLDRSGYLKLKDVICTRPSPAFSGIWPVMDAFINYIMLRKEVDQAEVLSVVKQFSTDPNLQIAAGAILNDEPLTLDEIILQNPEVLGNTSDKGQTLLHLAALLDRGGLVVKLISHHAMDPFVGDKDGITPVDLALHMGSMRAAQAIIHYTLRCEGYKLSSKQVDLLRIMERHLYEGSGVMTSTILLWTLFVKDEKVFTDEGIRQTMINDLLRRAIVQGNWFAFCNFLFWGADPNYTPPRRSRDEPPVDVLSMAVMLNQPLMVAVLLALGADPNGLGRFGPVSPLHYAAVGSGYAHDALKHGKETLYSRGKQMGHVPTFLNLYPCHPSDLQRFSIHILLKYGADIELPESSGRSPLSGAITTSQHTQSAMFLLDRKYPPDINSTDFKGFTALHHAVIENVLQRVDFCLKFGADPERKDLKGRTALAIAAGNGHLRICQRLLHAGANIAAKDANGNNCLELALHSEELTRFFLEVLRKGPTDKHQNVLNNRDHQGRTIIHVAVTSTSNKRVPSSVLKLLLEEGANPFLGDHIGYSPLHWVMASGDPKSAEDLGCERFETLLAKNPVLALLLHDDILGLTPVHFLILYGRADLFPVVKKHALLAYSTIADDVKGLLLPMTAIELLHKGIVI
jgi:ankyrin repeat protein